MAEVVPMTPEGHSRLSEELKRLREFDLPQVVKDIAIASELGDLSNNAEYLAAKERHGFIVARISYLEQTLARAFVIDPAKQNASMVEFGAKVRLMDLDSEQEESVQIVGPDEADSRLGRISVTSLFARGLLGHMVDDQVQVFTPSGSRTYQILGFSYL